MSDELRKRLITEIMKLAQTPKLIQCDPKPTIDDLEKSLNSDDPVPYSINPDGTVSRKHNHTVGDIADTVLRVLGEMGWKPPRSKKIKP
jgi:hypothetical protein